MANDVLTTVIEIGTTASTSMPVTVRDMTVEAANVLGSALGAIEPWLSYPISVDGLTSYCATIEPGAPRYAIYVGADLAGAIGLRTNWLRGPYLQLLGIVPAAQGMGVGQMVLDWIECGARVGQQRNFWVAAADYNIRAIQFYERHGFTHVATIDGLVHDTRSDVLLRKKLTTV